MLPDLSGLRPLPPALSPPKPPRSTVAQRLKGLAVDGAQLAAWKSALAWARDRADDHLVHMRNPDGREREHRLFEDYQPCQAKTYDDETLVEMLNWFVFAKEQYAAFAGR